LARSIDRMVDPAYYRPEGSTARSTERLTEECACLCTFTIDRPVDRSSLWLTDESTDCYHFGLG